VAQQPAWSDFPLLILTVSQATTLGHKGHSRFSEVLGNFSLLERPIRLETLIRAVTTALRARQRQYEIRDHLEERKRAEAALAKSEARHRGLVTATSAILWTAAADGAFVEPQESWQEYTGQAWEQHCGFGWLDAIYVDDRQPLVDGWQRAQTQRRVFQAEGRLWHHASHSYRHFELRAVPMDDAEGRIQEWVGLVADIEDRRLAENALRKSEKLASAGRLAATIAHEINNPLEAVTNLLFLAKADPSISPEGRKFLEMMDHELNRVVHITKQTLAFYRDSTGPSHIAPREVVDGLITIYAKRIAEKELNVRVECPADLHLISNPGEFRQVVSNLIANALDACSPTGTIVIRMRRTVANGLPGMRLTVADNGCGIVASHRRKVFEPFFTTKEKVGTGLGLWVSKDLIEKNGGTVRYRSSTGPHRPGTTFSIFLPDREPSGHD